MGEIILNSLVCDLRVLQLEKRRQGRAINIRIQQARLQPSLGQFKARAQAMVDLPTPPLQEEMAMTFLTLDKENGLVLILSWPLRPGGFHRGNQ